MRFSSIATAVTSCAPTYLTRAARVALTATSFFALATPLAQAASAYELPEEVSLRGKYESFTYESEYFLLDGKIWSKPNPANTGKHEPWALFQGTGVPFGPDVHQFGKQERIIQIDQDSTMVVALTERGRFYLWQPTLKVNTTWQEIMGAPFPGPLMLPKSRDWSFSLSAGPSSEKILPMHNIVHYYEDADGNKITFGITATIYVLDSSGQKIFFWDTGLPPTFFKGFLTPERGRFVAERIASAGSTILVIDANGRMFTRMFDYEMATGVPGVKFTYYHAHRTPDDTIGTLLGAVRTLPLPDWREQESIPLQGQAVITRNISILANGEGNAARELRVQGRDAQGRNGYYFKPIFGMQWRFKEATDGFYETDVIAHYGETPVLGRVMDKNYSGTLTQPLAPSLQLELIGFHYFESPATLRAHVGSKTFDMTLHTVDAWDPTIQNHDPDLIGSVNGEPKLLQATLQIPDSVLQSTDPEIRDAVKKYFLRFNMVPFALQISADDGQVELGARTFERKSKEYMDYQLLSPVIQATLTNSAGLAPEEVLEGFLYLATAPSLVIDDPEFLTAADLPRLREAIEENGKMLEVIHRINVREQTQYAVNGLTSAAFAAAFYGIANPLLNVIAMPSYQEEVGNVMLRGGSVLPRYAMMNLKKAFSEPKDYEYSLELIKRRIAAYEEQAARLNGKR